MILPTVRPKNPEIPEKTCTPKITTFIVFSIQEGAHLINYFSGNYLSAMVPGYWLTCYDIHGLTLRFRHLT